MFDALRDYPSAQQSARKHKAIAKQYDRIHPLNDSATRNDSAAINSESTRIQPANVKQSTSKQHAAHYQAVQHKLSKQPFMQCIKLITRWLCLTASAFNLVTDLIQHIKHTIANEHRLIVSTPHTQPMMFSVLMPCHYTIVLWHILQAYHHNTLVSLTIIISQISNPAFVSHVPAVYTYALQPITNFPLSTITSTLNKGVL